MSPQSVLASKEASTVVAFMIALLHVHALMMALEVSFPNKFFGAPIYCAWERIFTLLVMGFQVRFVVVAATEKLAASLYFALKVGLLLRGMFPGRSLDLVCFQ
jgi:hypothetical protein